MSSASITISNAPAGFVHAMGQPATEMTVTLDTADSFDVQAADDVLRLVFNMKDDDLAPLRFLDGCALDDATAALLHATCALARNLLIEGGVPAYAVDVITAVDKPTAPDTQTKITMAAPVALQMPRSHIFNAYSGALQFMWSYTQPADARPDPTQSANKIGDQLINPMRASLRRGASTKPITQEAYNRGIPISYLADGVYQIGYGHAARLTSMSGTDGDSQIGARIVHRKDHTQTILNSVGAPTAQMIMVADADSAVQAAQHLGFPVVVKPADLDRSEGVHVDLGTAEAVRRAYAAARKLSANIMVQQRIPGHCHRLVTFQGRFVFGFTRYPAAVKGDGEKTVRALANAHNDRYKKRAKHLGAKPVPFDDRSLACLNEQGFSPDQILDDGQVAYLRRNNLIDFAGHTEIITDRVHSDNVALIERLSALFRLESCGFDLISPDPAVPWHENGAAITELNFHPQIGDNTARANLAALYPTTDDALVPITCFVGGDAAMKAGQKALAKLHNTGTHAVLFSHDTVLQSDGSTMHLHGAKGLLPHSLVALRHPSVEAVIVVVQNDLWTETGPPFTGKITVELVDDDLHSRSDPTEKLTPEAAKQLVKVLKAAASVPS